MAVDGPKADGILVVDDQQMMRDLIASMCKSLGFADVCVAATGSEAIEMMIEQPFRLIMSDWKMKPMSGLDLLRVVRTDGRLQGTKFLMMTTHANSDFLIAAKSCGVDGFILKPFTKQALSDKISRTLGIAAIQFGKEAPTKGL